MALMQQQVTGHTYSRLQVIQQVTGHTAGYRSYSRLQVIHIYASAAFASGLPLPLPPTFISGSAAAFASGSAATAAATHFRLRLGCRCRCRCHPPSPQALPPLHSPAEARRVRQGPAEVCSTGEDGVQLLSDIELYAP